MSNEKNSLETTTHKANLAFVSMNMFWQEVILYFGEWETVSKGDQDFHRSNTQYNAFEFSFRGPTVKWIGSKGKDHGFADVYIDGEPQATVDCYSPTTQTDVVKFEKIGLSEDRIHTLRVVILKDRNPESADCYQDVSSIQAVTPVVYRAQIAQAMTDEYKEIQNGTKAFLPPDSWAPVKGAAKVPQSGVTLGPGVFNEAFNRNIDYLNHSFASPTYCDVEA